MVFSSGVFLFLFLPIVLAVYYICPGKLRNTVLFVFSLIFYAWGEPIYVGIMIFSTAFDYCNGMLIETFRKKHNEKICKIVIIMSVVVNLGILAFFKYTDFVITNINNLFGASVSLLQIALPIGISFYTFQTLSYTIDVYLGKVKVQHNIINFGMYVSMFPQLIAGPIVRYTDIAKMLDERRENISQFADGIKLFAVGLAKKVLIANQMGVLWDTIRGTSSNGIVGAWIGIISYAFQIYFDFSGYSDMACGLGKMFGFEFMKNFNYPYVSKTITEFWHRWHISLSSWFRDYVYIPLGGNRCKLPRVIFNLFAVWALTGLWHGANFNFIAWGIYYFVILVLEKYVYGKYLEKLPSLLKHIYALFLILLGWTIFYFEDFGQFATYLTSMFTLKNGIIGGDTLSTILMYLPILIVTAMASLPIWKNTYLKLKDKKYMGVLEIAFCAVVIVLCTASLVNQSYNPFLYFRF